MSLNIKNEHVHDLVREAANLTGLSQTRVVEVSVERLLASLQKDRSERREAEISKVIADFDRRLTPQLRARLTTEDLYDASGLPA